MDGTQLRADLLDLEPYDPDMRPVDVMLSANENNYGLPGPVREELLRRVADEPLNRYPEATAPRVRALLAQLWGVRPANVVVGNGGDELIFNLLLAFGGPGRALVNCPPTFSAYELYARLTMTPVIDVPRAADFVVDEPAVLAAARRDDAAIVVLTSPNNPSGNLGRVGFVRELAQVSDALIVVDEAYGEFCAPEASCMPLVAEFPNVCVLRTLSKAYALAGARMGYVVCGERVADGLLAVRQPYSVSRLDQLAAEVVLERRAELRPAVEAVVAERARLTGLLRALAAELAGDADELAGLAGADGAAGLTDAGEASLQAGPRIEVFDSEANFVLVRLPEPGPDAPAGAGALPSADEVHERLAAASILVRNFSHTPGLEGCLRISVGRPEETDVLVARLREILGLSPEPASQAAPALAAMRGTPVDASAPAPGAVAPASPAAPAPGAAMSFADAAPTGTPTAPTTRE